MHTNVMRNPPIISERESPTGKFLFVEWKKTWAIANPAQIISNVTVCVRIIGNIWMSMNRNHPQMSMEMTI